MCGRKMITVVDAPLSPNKKDCNVAHVENTLGECFVTSLVTLSSKKLALPIQNLKYKHKISNSLRIL